jgi:hypothetical protein
VEVERLQTTAASAKIIEGAAPVTDKKAADDSVATLPLCDNINECD